jgi:hypothetical protein
MEPPGNSTTTGDPVGGYEAYIRTRSRRAYGHPQRQLRQCLRLEARSLSLGAALVCRRLVQEMSHG